MTPKFFNNTYERERKKLLKMECLLDSIKNYADNCRPDLMHDAVSQLVRAAQDFAMYTRMIPAGTGILDTDTYLQGVYDDTFSIKVKVTPEGWLQILMPPLLPREIGSPQFIREPLNAKLKEFDAEYRNTHDGYPLFFQSGVMIFYHHYDQSRPERELHDLDNYEKNGIADSIVFYYLSDDRPKYCINLELSEPSEKDYTEIYLIPQKDLIKWLVKHQLSLNN